MRKRSLVVLVASVLLALLLAAPASARPAAFESGHATLHPANQSGAMGTIQFSNATGPTTATGAATGLAPSFGRYASLVYDRGSVPGGPDNCEPSPGNAMPGMFVGIWSVNASGNGTLIFIGPTAPLGTFDTVSIRDSTINGGFGPQAVVACGEVALKPAD